LLYFFFFSVFKDFEYSFDCYFNDIDDNEDKNEGEVGVSSIILYLNVCDEIGKQDQVIVSED